MDCHPGENRDRPISVLEAQSSGIRHADDFAGQRTAHLGGEAWLKLDDPVLRHDRSDATTETEQALKCDRAAWCPNLTQTALAALSLPVLLPPLVVAIAIVVLFVRGLGVGLGIPIVILGHSLVTQPFVILIVMARLARFDQSAVDAARGLGATRWQAFRLAVLPQIASALVGAALVSAAISLDDFILASFTIGGGNTISTYVWGKMRTTLDPSINAIATILLR